MSIALLMIIIIVLAVIWFGCSFLFEWIGNISIKAKDKVKKNIDK